MDSAVNTLFSEISLGKLNSEILAETLVIDKLREEVVRRLTQIEKLDLGFSYPVILAAGVWQFSVRDTERRAGQRRPVYRAIW